MIDQLSTHHFWLIVLGSIPRNCTSLIFLTPTIHACLVPAGLSGVRSERCPLNHNTTKSLHLRIICEIFYFCVLTRLYTVLHSFSHNYNPSAVLSIDIRQFILNTV